MPGWATSVTEEGSEEYEGSSDYFNGRTEEVDTKTEAVGVGE